MLFKRKIQDERPSSSTIEVAEIGDRRDEANDRRTFRPASKFPLIDSENKHVLQDRRSRPERRLNNIVVRETRINLSAKY